tara:strand:- start:19 stop:588 length:570 start_codon:yes stop_codon:yes gene_type:complete
MLRLNILCLERGVQHEISYVNDDVHAKNDIIKRKMKDCDKLFFIDFGIHVDEGSLLKIFENHDCLVFPAASEGIDWEMFKMKVLNDVDEPVEQFGLHFDTEIGNKVSDDIYKVVKTNPKSWVIKGPLMHKTLKNKKSPGITLPLKSDDMFERLGKNGMKIYAYSGTKLTVTYPHECLSNILEAAGVTLK